MIHVIETEDKLVVTAIGGIAQTKARLVLKEVTIGLQLAAGGSQHLPKLIGVPAVFITTGCHVPAAEALNIGIVDQVTDHSTMDTAMKLALGVCS